MKWENVHIFVSSTFNDMHAERDYLVKRVFPKLSAWCEERRLRLIDIDLRWGVSEADATQNRRVVQVCLNRIDECRPFFLCFLGQRRGWVPSSDEVDYENIEKKFPLLIEKSKEDKSYRKKGESCLGHNSVTEMEILHARIDPMHNGTFFDNAGNKKDGSSVEHAFFFLRDPEYLQDLTHADLVDVYTNKSDKNPKTADYELHRWREEIIPATGRPVIHYTADWNKSESTYEIALPLVTPTTAPYKSDLWKVAFIGWKERWAKAGITVSENGEITDPDELEKAKSYNELFTKGRLSNFREGETTIDNIIIKQLQDAITERFGKRIVKQLTPLQIELDQQEQFLRIASEGFIERQDDFKALNEYLNDETENRPFALTTFAGMGKTSWLAHWISTNNRKVHYRFIGGSDDSTNVVRLLRSLLGELKEAGKIDSDIPVDDVEMRNIFPYLLEEAGKKGKTMLVIDALNQLETGMTDLYWIPKRLPENVKLIVSFKRGDAEAEKYYNEREAQEDMVLHSLEPFNYQHRIQLVSAYLEQYFKELDTPRIGALISSKGAENPLFLKIALSELRVFGVHNDLTTVISERFGDTTVSAFDAVLNRMESDPAYTKLKPIVALSHIFGWLSHSRYGLSVEELSCLLIRKKLTDDPEESLDVIFLAIRQLRPFLAKRDGRIDFLYESFKTAAKERYTQHHRFARTDKNWHQSLSDFFETLPLTNRHRLMEQAWQLYKSNEVSSLFSLLTGATYITAKQSENMITDLIDDYNRYLEITVDVSPDIKLLKERLRLLAPVLWQYPELAKQTLLGGLLPVSILKEKDVLQATVRAKKGIELHCLGGDIYGKTGILQLDSGKFLAASPNGKLLLSIKESLLHIIDASTFKTLRTYPATLSENETFMGAVSDEGKTALMDIHGCIHAGIKKVQSDRRYLLYSETGSIITVINNTLCSLTDETNVIVSGTPTCISLKKSFMAFEMNGTIFVYHNENKKWTLHASFPAGASGIKAIAISEDLTTILTLFIMRLLIRQNMHTGEILTSLSYIQEAGLALTRLPFACGESSNNKIYLSDCESNTACFDLNTKKGVNYLAAFDANHPRFAPVALVTNTDEAVLLLPSTAILITGEAQVNTKGHVGGVTSLGFLNENKLFTQMKNDMQTIYYNTDGTVLTIDPVENFPLTAAPCGDYVAVSLSDHKVGLIKAGSKYLLDNGNMPFSAACEFLDSYGGMLFMGTKNEIKRTQIAEKFSAVSVYKTSGREQIKAMAAIDNRNVVCLIVNEIFEHSIGITSNGILMVLDKIDPCDNLCVSPNGDNICFYGNSTWIINVSTKEKTRIADSCRCACFITDRILACAFTMNGNMLDFVDIHTSQTVKKLFLPDKAMSMVSDNNRILCGLINGNAVLLHNN